MRFPKIYNVFVLSGGHISFYSQLHHNSFIVKVSSCHDRNTAFRITDLPLHGSDPACTSVPLSVTGGAAPPLEGYNGIKSRNLSTGSILIPTGLKTHDLSGLCR